MSWLEPRERPSGKEALEQFEECLKEQNPIALRWRLRRDDEGIIPSAVRDLRSAASELVFQVRTVTCKRLEFVHMVTVSSLSCYFHVAFLSRPLRRGKKWLVR